MPCSSSAADNSSFHLIEIEDDPENLVEVRVENDTSKEQEVANVRSEDEHDVNEDEINVETTSNSAKTGKKRKTPYSIKFGELPEAIRKFLASVKKFFTQKVNFEREKAPVTLSTYEKAQERMLCKYLYNIATSRAMQSNSVCVSVLKIPIVHSDGVSNIASPLLARGKHISRLMDTNRGSAH